MDVLVPFISTNKPQKEKTLSYFARGVSRHGDVVTTTDAQTMPDLEQVESHTVGVYYGALKKDRLHYDQRQQVKQLMHHHYDRCVVLETPLIDRQQINEEFRVGINGNLRNNAQWAWSSIDPDRVKKFYQDREFDIHREWREQRGSKILLVMQNHDDLATQGIDSFQWTLRTIEQLKAHTDRHIVVRSNPFHAKRENEPLLNFRKQLAEFDNVEFSYSGRRQTSVPIEKDLQDAWCVVCHSSGVSVDAVIRGIPVICTGESCMAWDVCGHDLSQVEDPVRPDPVPWFEKMAMIQYSQAEFHSGECWNYVRPLCS